jgi:hypothetical protein
MLSDQAILDDSDNLPLEFCSNDKIATLCFFDQPALDVLQVCCYFHFDSCFGGCLQ